RRTARAVAIVVCPLLAMTARGAAVVEAALTRARVLDAKLLTQTASPAAATMKPGAAVAGGATRIGRPTASPERRSIRATIPRTGSPTNKYCAALANDAGAPPMRIGSATG